MTCAQCKCCTSRFCPNCGECVNGDIPDQIIQRLRNGKRAHEKHITHWTELPVGSYSHVTSERKKKEIEHGNAKLKHLDTLIDWVRRAAKKTPK